jgi:alpha-L-arabinofuranosidase
MACQFNSGELCPLDQLGPYIQDALDLVEFANGPVTSEWGGKRASLGHPEPFNLKMMGVGNEQWGPQYVERFALFAKALKAKYPEIQLIAASGPDPADSRFKFLWSQLRTLNADIIDEHSYAKPSWFLSNSHRYDDYDRSGPKVFMGEYAAQSVATVSVKNRNNLECALAEAAFMTGLERNADVVRLASYAPLFANADAWQWTPDLIWVNPLMLYRTPNYFTQQLFSRNRGDEVLPTTLSGDPESPIPVFFASATREQATGEVILKVVNAGDAPCDAQIKLDTGATVAPTGRVIVLSGVANSDVNSFAHPEQVAPVDSALQDVSRSFNHMFPARSFTVLRLPVK